MALLKDILALDRAGSGGVHTRCVLRAPNGRVAPAAASSPTWAQDAGMGRGSPPALFLHQLAPLKLPRRRHRGRSLKLLLSPGFHVLQ